MKETSSLPTIIFRHKKENLKKCSLKGLENRKDFKFFSYPDETLPKLDSYILLAMEGEELSEKDNNKGILLIDSTWNYLEKMLKQTPISKSQCRSIPSNFRTAYPRKQTKCHDPSRGLASIEALYIAFLILKKDPSTLLEYYYWKDQFLKINSLT